MYMIVGMKKINPKKRYKTKHPGVRFKYHETRKNKTRPDKYFSIYYQLNKKQIEEGIGWSSQGFNQDTVFELLKELKQNHKTGVGPQTLKQMRELEEAQRERKRMEALLIQKQNISFTDFFDQVFLPRKKRDVKNRETWRKPREHAKNWLKPIIGHLPLKDITEIHLEKIKDNMLDAGRAPSMIEKVFTTFGSVWNMAKDRDLLTGKNPKKKVKLPKYDNKSLRYFTKDEADELLTALKKRSLQWYQMCLISLHTGMRIGEVWNLTWGDVNLQTKIGTARDTKSGGKTRYVYFTKQAIEILKEKYHKKVRPNEIIFKNSFQEKTVRVSSTVYRVIEDLEYNLGVTDRKYKASCHTFRHTYASWLAQTGKVTLHELKELLGHRTIQQTERYAKLMPQGIQFAASQFEDIIS